jgi:hypothetical protein
MTDETNLPARSGPRPETGPAIPHQQLSQNAPESLQEELWRRMIGLEGVRTGPSGVSLPETRALHLEGGLAVGPPEAFMVGTEFAHLHGLEDGSLHLALPAELARDAIESGWAELHPLAEAGRLPRTLVMVYGPRDGGELETVWQLVVASYDHARGRNVRPGERDES